MRDNYRATQVFVPGGMPRHTYVERQSTELEARLRSVSDNLCKLATLTGATKSGKTVLASRVFPRGTGENVWIDGGSVRQEDDLWLQILAELGGHTEYEYEEGAERTNELAGKLEAEAKLPLIASGKGEVQATTGRTTSTTTRKALAQSPRAAAVSALRRKGKPLVIDDFHYLDRGLQGDIVRALKPLVFEGQPVLIIAIPHRRYDAVKVEREMTGRLENIIVPAWTATELVGIARAGFPLLNAELADTVCTHLADQAFGSPHLMQEFCREICTREGISETLEKHVSISFVPQSLFQSIAEGTGKVIFEKLAKGPTQRTDRKPRPLVVGGDADIYRVVLLALARMSPGMDRVDYESLRTAIRATVKTDAPQAHEVSRVLESMSEIASKDEAATPVIDWDKDDRMLHVTDPFFAFFLKWGEVNSTSPQ